MDNEPVFKLIKNKLTYEQRIKARINSFRNDILSGQADVEYTNEVLKACLDYLSQYEDDDVYNAAVKVKESIFYLNNFINYEE